MSTENLMLLAIFFPIVWAVIPLVLVKKNSLVAGVATIIASFVNLGVVYLVYGNEVSITIPWAGWFFEFTLRNYQFSSFILSAAAVFGALLSIYNTVFLKNKTYGWLFHAYFLLTLGFVNGAILADNLLLLLFFWEGLLGLLFGMIYLGHRDAFRTATKAVVIAGVTDLCMMFGIGMAVYLAKTATMSQMKVPLEGWGALAFVLLVIGAISKAGSMPFHTWIPDAASDAPMPFLPFIPAALEKLMGIYLLARITLDFFDLQGGHWGSTMLMVVGAVTINLAVFMALIQKDYKRLLSYHAISQVGYMILGIGTCTPVGIVGGLFHMINHTIYKCCLFLTSGSVERQAGTTDLKKLGGLGRKMPITFTIFIVAAASISGIFPFNGFFSKELVYDGALERHWIFYAAAILGSFLTTASFLKLGHAAFADKPRGDVSKVKEAPFAMLLPGIVLALLCIFFGLGNVFPLHNFIQPILGDALHGHDFAGFHFNAVLVAVSVVVLLLAVANHFIGFKSKKSGLAAVDHIHYAPGLHQVYDAAEKRFFDPYNWAKNVGKVVAYAGFGIDRAIDFFFSKIVVFVATGISGTIRALHTGSHATYLAWTLVGLVIVIVACMTGRL
ncbi:MAG: NADH-quinone oxidoreductase subunit L [Acidobacteriota bacterium]|jgi:NADH-quinone oxidoreductase subunit L|nr:NADH-quinone oxidoreductase subunit L [Acidobacteriota bacterium]